MRRAPAFAAFAAFLAGSIASHSAAAAPVAFRFDDDRAFRAAGYESLAATLLPISAGLTESYALGFRLDAATGLGGFDDGVPPALLPPGQAIGFRLIAATPGEASHTLDDGAVPFAQTLTGVVEPQAIALLLPAVQTVREPPDTSGDGPTCEPPPEPVCEAPPGPGPFEPVDWLVFDFAETLLAIDLRGAYAFRPAAQNVGPSDMALEIHYLRRAVAEPATLGLLAAGLLAARLGRRRAKPPQPS